MRNLSLVFLFLLGVAFTQTLNHHQALKNSMLRAKIAANGDIPIHRNEFGYYVKASYNLVDPKEGKFQIALTNEETILPNECLEFSGYQCTEPNCEESKGPSKTVTTPYFSAQATLGKTLFNINGNAKVWNQTYLARNCSDDVEYYGEDRIGIIGLAGKNRILPFQAFAIYLLPVTQGLAGYIHERKTPANSSTQTPVAVIPTNSFWQAQGSVRMEIGSHEISNTSFAAKIIFDLNTEAIALPLSIFAAFIKNFEQILASKCYLSDFQAICKYSGILDNLPTISLYFGNQKIPIPPKVYVKQFLDIGQIILNFKLLDPNQPGPGYIRPEFENTIILDATIMKQYYTVFDGFNGVNNVYLYKWPLPTF